MYSHLCRRTPFQLRQLAVTKGNCKAPIKPAQRLTWSTVSWSRLEHVSPTDAICQIKGFVHPLLSPSRPPTISSPSIRPNPNLQSLYLLTYLPLIRGLEGRCQLSSCLSVACSHCASFAFISLGMAWECDLDFSDLFWAVTSTRLCLWCLHWQAVMERNGNRLQKSSQRGNWFSFQVQWFPAGMMWDGPCSGGILGKALQQRYMAIWGRKDCFLWNLLWIFTPMKCRELLWLETGLNLDLISDGGLDSARKYPRGWRVCSAEPFAVERQTRGRFLAVVSELCSLLTSYSIVLDCLHTDKSLPASSQWLDP